MNKYLLYLLIWVVAYLSGSLLLDKKADAPLAFTLPTNQFLLRSGEILIIEEHSAPQIIPAIQHSGFAPDDPRQEIVAEAYGLWGLEFVTMLECENGLRDPQRVGDTGKSHWLCQLNTRRHPEPFLPERNDRRNQLSVCFEKRKGRTKFFWPTRKINGKACHLAVQERFRY